MLLSGMLLLGHIALSQELEKVTKRHQNWKEEYQVLKSDKNIRHGIYELSQNDVKKVMGLYDNGRKSGRWIILSNVGEPQLLYNYQKKQLEVSNTLGAAMFPTIDSVSETDDVTYPGAVIPASFLYREAINWLSQQQRLQRVSGEIRYEIRAHIDENNKLTLVEIHNITDDKPVRGKFKIEEIADHFFSATFNSQPVPSIWKVEMAIKSWKQ